MCDRHLQLFLSEHLIRAFHSRYYLPNLEQMFRPLLNGQLLHDLLLPFFFIPCGLDLLIVKITTNSFDYAKKRCFVNNMKQNNKEIYLWFVNQIEGDLFNKITYKYPLLFRPFKDLIKNSNETTCEGLINELVVNYINLTKDFENNFNEFKGSLDVQNSVKYNKSNLMIRPKIINTEPFKHNSLIKRINFKYEIDSILYSFLDEIEIFKIILCSKFNAFYFDIEINALYYFCINNLLYTNYNIDHILEFILKSENDIVDFKILKSRIEGFEKVTIPNSSIYS